MKRDQAEFLDVAAQQFPDEGQDAGLYPAARVGEHAYGQRGLVIW